MVEWLTRIDELPLCFWIRATHLLREPHFTWQERCKRVQISMIIGHDGKSNHKLIHDNFTAEFIPLVHFYVLSLLWTPRGYWSSNEAQPSRRCASAPKYHGEAPTWDDILIISSLMMFQSSFLAVSMIISIQFAQPLFKTKHNVGLLNPQWTPVIPNRPQ